MKTGLKYTFIKLLKSIEIKILGGINSEVFPNSPRSPAYTFLRFAKLRKQLKDRRVRESFGSIYTVPHSSAVAAYTQFVSQNPGNLGEWSNNKLQTYASTEFEYEVIHQLFDLYHTSHKEMAGYITSGGTESNLFLTWLGRTKLEKKVSRDKIRLLMTSLTHYSIRKASEVCGVEQVTVPLNRKTWGIDSESFEIIIRKQLKMGVTAFLVPLTVGYTSTGTSDDIKKIIKKARLIKKSFHKIQFFFWIDAAFNGLINPFTQDGFRPFLYSEISGIVVDFHKFGQVPYPAGIVLYKRKLQKYIKKPIDYLAETDITLTGSRSGLPAISIWAIIQKLGKHGLQREVEIQMSHKRLFIQYLINSHPKLTITTEEQSLTCGLVFPYKKDHHYIPTEIEQRYNLYPGESTLLFAPNSRQKFVIYKIFFMPHLTKKIILSLAVDLKHAFELNN